GLFDPFPGTLLSTTNWSSNGTVTVSGGLASLNGSTARSSNTFTPGTSPAVVEFFAKFVAAPNQQIGFGMGGAGNFFNSPNWAMFSTNTGTQLYARSNNGTATDTALGTGFFDNQF